MESINIRRDRALQQPQEREREEKGGGREKCPTEEEEVRDGEKIVDGERKEKIERRKMRDQPPLGWHWNKMGGGESDGEESPQSALTTSMI